MKQIVLFGCAILTIFMLAGSAAAGNQIDTDDIYIMAYYDVLYEIDLSSAIKEFDYVSESTGQYVEGTVTIWHNYRDGRDTGSSLDMEIKDGTVSDIPFSTDVTVRVKSDGWIVAWLTNEQDLSDMVFWNDVDDPNKRPSDTTLGQAIWRIADRVGAGYDKSNVEYYSYEYPDADRLLIGGSLRLNGYTYYFLVPSPIILYEANLLWTAYLNDYQWPGHPVHCYNYGIIKMDQVDIYNKNTSDTCMGVYEYAKYSRNIPTDIPRDIRHTIYMQSSGWSSDGQTLLGTAVALLYKAG